MAASNLNLGKASGGVLNIQPADGTTTTSIVLPASGTVTTNEYVNSSNLGNGSTTFNGFGGTGFKNYIINGDMRIAQRGSGPFTTTGYGIDRWFSYISTTNSSITRIWIGTGSNHPSYAQVAVGAGTDTVTMEQRVEYPHQFGGKTLTLSMFLFNGTYTGTNVPCEIALNHAGGRTILFSGNLTFSLSRVSVTFTVPDLSSYTLNSNSYLEIRPVNIINRGYTGVFGIKDVQLEAGSVATPFEQRPYGLELSLCQRYYQQSIEGRDVTTNSWYSNNGGALCVDMEDVALCGLRFPIEMRVSPTFTPYVNGTALRIKSYGGDATRIVSSVDVNKHGVSGFRHDGGYTIGRPYAFTWIANAEL